jgi:ferritin-like metal-binding protein YciE
MESSVKSLENLQNLLDYEACQFHVAEIHLKNILPEWIERTESVKLKSVLEKYKGIIESHVQKLENFIQDEGLTSECIDNRVMRAFIEDIGEKLGMCSDQHLKDAALLASVQEINHYKISAYGTATAFANTLNMPRYAAIFHEIEINEKQIDDRLSQLAEFEINVKAKAPEEQPKGIHPNGFALP